MDHSSNLATILLFYLGLPTLIGQFQALLLYFLNKSSKSIINVNQLVRMNFYFLRLIDYYYFFSLTILISMLWIGFITIKSIYLLNITDIILISIYYFFVLIDLIIFSLSSFKLYLSATNSY